MAENVEKTDALFVNLVLLFKNAALQQMGKIMNPISGKIEKSMEQARFSIDMIEMLKAKTRGNISDDLDKLLDSTLLELRMNYVEEAEADEKRAADEKTSKPDSNAETQPLGAAAEEARAASGPDREGETSAAEQGDQSAGPPPKQKGEGAGHNTTKERSSSKSKAKGKRSTRGKESG